MEFVTTVLAFVVLLTVLVFVHEMGHYLVARWCGVKVEVFSIGFGPELYGWTDRRETRWKIAAVPFGGYVKFFGDLNAASAPDGSIVDKLSADERARAFHHKPLLQRVAIVVAGPFANILYSIVVLAVMFATFGQRVTPPEVGSIEPNSAAAEAGFERGDIILAIAGNPVDRFEEVVGAYLLNPGRELVFLVRRGDEELEIRATPRPRTTSELDGIERVIGELGLEPAVQTLIGKVYPDSAAEQAGLQAGDRVVAVDGAPITSFGALQKVVGASEGRLLRVTVVRDDAPLDFRVAPKYVTLQRADGSPIEGWLLGIQSAPQPLIRFGPVKASTEAVRTSVNMVTQTISYIGEMISGDRGTEDLGGPLRIAHASGQAARVGVEQLIMLSVLLSLNLGIINLLPVPVLDGGHLLLYVFEAIRGRPLTERMQEYAFRLGLAMILTLAIFVTWNDLVQLKVVEFIVGIF